MSAAITGVTARIKAVEDEKRRQEEAAAIRAAEEQRLAEIKAAVPEPVPEVTAPVEIQSEEKIYMLRFTVKGTKDKLRELKAFLDNGGYKYE